MLMLQRIDYLDIAKGFGIIFVILGHCMLGHNSSLHSVLYSFHMPLFFFISGICFSGKYSFVSLVVKRFRQMILPTIWFSLISVLVVEGLNLDVKWWDWSKHLPFALWFLPILYFSELIAWVICNKVINKVCLTILLLSLMLIPHFLSLYSIELPYSVAAIPTATFFYMIGNKTKSFVLNWDKHLWLLVTLLTMLNLIVVRYGHVSIELASGRINPVFIAEFAAFCGLFSCLSLSKCIGGGISTRPSAHLVRTKQSLLNVGTSINKDYFRRVHWMPVFK